MSYVLSTIEPPYIANMRNYGLIDDEIDDILYKIFGSDSELSFLPGYIKIYDNRGNQIYVESWSNTFDDYEIREFDENSNQIYYENPNFWKKERFGEEGNTIYYEDSLGNNYDYR